MFPQAAVPTWRSDTSPGDAAKDVIGAMREWLTSQALHELVKSWEEDVPEDKDLGDLLEWYEEFTAKYWDFRAGRERNLVGASDFTTEKVNLVLEAASALGMAEARSPRYAAYDHVLILGGLVRACVVRPAYAADLERQGVTFGSVTALGGFRPLLGDELELARDLGVHGLDEFQAMIEGVSRAFSLDEPPQFDGAGADGGNSNWAVASFRSAQHVKVIAAPSSDPAARRANSIDTYLWWAHREGALDGKRVLLITTSIYVPYQGAGAVEALGLTFGCEVETVGVPSSAADLGPHTQQYRADHYLQEIRSAIRGYRSLHGALARRGLSG